MKKSTFARYCLLFVLLSFACVSVRAQASRPLTPAETVREFYKALRDKRFREAFSLSTYRPAVESLTAEEMAELEPDFVATAANVPEKIDISDEAVNGDTAKLIVNLAEPDEPVVPKEMRLRRENGVWLVADEEEERVKKEGRNYFFRLRIDTHHDEAEEMMGRIYKAQVVYQIQKGRFGDISALVAAGLLPADIKEAVSTGYQYRVNINADGKSYGAWAEPARYGRTGKLSFYVDQSGRLQRDDNQGKPLTPKK